MLRITFFFSILFSVLLSFFWPRSHDESPAVPFLWQFDLNASSGTARPAELQDLAPFNLVLARAAPADGAEAAGRGPGADVSAYLKGPMVPPLALQKSERVFAPFLGNGYFSYAKLGRELSFHSRTGEELWRKSYKAYPVSDVSGKLVLLLTGDNNRVDLIDANGNPAGVRSVAGNFMTDLDFATRTAAAALVFSTGDLSVLDARAQPVLRYRHRSDEQPLFFKSCAIAPDGGLVAVHMLSGDTDHILVLGYEHSADPEQADPRDPGDYRLLRDIDLKAVYPHLLHFAVNAHGLILAAPDKTAFFALGSGADREMSFRPAGVPAPDAAPAAGAPVAPVYRPVFADREFFAYGENDAIVVLNRAGRPLTRLVLGTDGPIRIMPGPRANQFALETPDRVEIYAYRDAADATRTQ